MKVIYIALAILLLLPLQAHTAEARLKTIRVYDAFIERAVKRYWPDVPIPELLKAQLYAESNLNAFATSPVGAKGIAQFMPETWAEVSKAIGQEGATRLDARASIFGGAYYMASLRNYILWREADLMDRHTLAQASYNAGVGNVAKAVKAAHSTSWLRVAVRMASITGKHSKETLDYVDRIWRYFNELLEDPASARSKVLAHALGLTT